MKLLLLFDDESLREQAHLHAQSLSADVFTEVSDLTQWKPLFKQFSHSAYDALLLLQIERGLSLLSLVQHSAMKPVYIDFNSAEWQRRLFNISSKTELAARALGLGLDKSKQHQLVDANAGLGQDTFVFAALGAQVHACERSTLIYLLLYDALRRAEQHEHLCDMVSRIQLHHMDAKNFLATLPDDCSVHSVYLDPMFPDKKHQAAAKKEMQIFQTLLGADQDADELLEHAISFKARCAACTRVVLKRPRLAPVLNSSLLARQLSGNSTRFDIYF